MPDLSECILYFETSACTSYDTRTHTRLMVSLSGQTG